MFAVPLQKRNLAKISIDFKVSRTLSQNNCVIVPARYFSFLPAIHHAKKEFIQSWEALGVDRYMADGGSYRLRRYGEFCLNTATSQLKHQPNTTFYQSLEINPLNGGIDRAFPPLLEKTINNPFLHSLIRVDFKNLPYDITRRSVYWKVGIHQIKIRAIPGCPGNPTPEGIHRDDEMFTVQHLIKRHNITGGENHFYGHGASPSVEVETILTQENLFDSYFFNRSVWHSVSSIDSADGITEGYRDIILLDFVPIESLH